MTSCALSAQIPAEGFDPSRKLRYVDQIIQTFYVDSVPSGQMVDNAIIAMLKTLDPHSSYSDPQETKELTEPLQGNFSGIGIQFRMISDTLYVVQTIQGGPSERVGIVAGDRILSANDTLISGVKMPNSQVMKHLRGPKGTVVNVSVLRKGVKDPVEFRIIRDDIPLYSVDAYYMAEPGVGYIRVSRFAETTADEVAAAMADLQKQGMTDLVIDLQDNGGGYLGTAVELAEMLLGRDDLIVYTEGDKAPAAYYRAERNGTFRNGRVAVLVNQYSASASEILSGAVQDNDRGVVVGRRTFGKGLVQRPFPFPDGSMIRLTVARYYTPAGRCIQKPYTMGDEESYRDDMLVRYKSGEFMSADSIHFNDSLRYTTINRGRTVYGGGGIMPDRFVPVDTSFYSDYYRDLMAKGILATYSVNYVDAHRKQILRDYPTEDSFVNDFKVTEPIMNGLIEAARKDGIDFNEEQFATSREYIATVLKGLIGTDLYSRSTYFRIINPLNPVYNEALEILRTPGAYDAILRSDGFQPSLQNEDVKTAK